MEHKNYKLEVIWKSIEDPRVHTFIDNTQCVFLPWVKIERWMDESYMKEWQYELLLTTSNSYSIATENLVDYAYEHGLRTLSDCLVLTSATKQIEKAEDGYQMHPDTLQKYKDIVELLEPKKNVINFNFNIYESNKSRETRETVQEVRPNT